jgi:cytochrome oxidase Cu insertion factor (SCO1/SenC/PrrC family)
MAPVGIARGVGGAAARQTKTQCRPALTHASWVNIKAGWYDAGVYLRLGPSHLGTMLRSIRWAAYGLIALLVLGWGAAWLRPDLMHGLMGGNGSVTVGGPFALIDTDGKPVTDQTYRGKWMLVYFGYTFCPDVCPTELQAVANALDLLGPDAAKIVPLFITIDPARDTRTAMADYVKLFSPRLIGLTGTEAQIAQVARAYRVYYAKVQPKTQEAYLMDHSSFLYLMGPDGAFRAIFHPGLGGDELAKGLRGKMIAG